MAPPKQASERARESKAREASKEARQGRRHPGSCQIRHPTALDKPTRHPRSGRARQDDEQRMVVRHLQSVPRSRASRSLGRHWHARRRTVARGGNVTRLSVPARVRAHLHPCVHAGARSIPTDAKTALAVNELCQDRRERRAAKRPNGASALHCAARHRATRTATRASKQTGRAHARSHARVRYPGPCHMSTLPPHFPRHVSVQLFGAVT
mmetsp:Transcript_57849/g.179745  ORF Transcript_57849/g.179745 Transcript_57849/m.179745 type:complete len:210 (+) Transcript_57849:168-797(+)